MRYTQITSNPDENEFAKVVAVQKTRALMIDDIAAADRYDGQCHIGVASVTPHPPTAP